jgi:hypothetical protein
MRAGTTSSSPRRQYRCLILRGKQDEADLRRLVEEELAAHG